MVDTRACTGVAAERLAENGVSIAKQSALVVIGPFRELRSNQLGDGAAVLQPADCTPVRGSLTSD
jgi:hypothetical protein